MASSLKEARESLRADYAACQRIIDEKRRIQKECIIKFLKETHDLVPKKSVYLSYPYNQRLQVITLPGLRFYSPARNLFLDSEGWDEQRQCGLVKIIPDKEAERYILSPEFMTMLVEDTNTLFL